MRTMTWVLVGLLCLGWGVLAQAQDRSEGSSTYKPVRLDFALTLMRFEQQVKSEIGGARGERLVEDSLVGAGLWATWRPVGLSWLGVGGFARFDAGQRSAGRFEGLDAEGRTVVGSETGGAFQELWLGPIVRASWKSFFAEFGYGALGLRWDDAREDLPAQDGDTEKALRTSSSVAWIGAVGGGIPVADSWDVVFRLEYRVRYYDRRESMLFDELVHGTQNFTPFVGVSWVPGW